MLATPGFTLLSVNLENMTTKPKVVGSSKNCIACEVEKAVHCFVHTEKVTKKVPLKTSKKSRIRCRTVMVVTHPFYDFAVSIGTLSSASKSREIKGKDACIAFSRCCRIYV